MAEKILSSDDIEITTDTMASNSSTPKRVGSFKSHGRHSGDNDSPTVLSMDQNNSSTMMASSQQPCLSSSLAQNSNNAPNTVNMSNSINIGGGGGGGGGGAGAVAGGSVSSSVTPPNSAGLRQTAGAFETKFMRRTSSLRILLPKLSSTDSISYSPVSTSSGLANWAIDSRDKYDGNQTDKSATDASKLNRKESYKAQRKNYRREKKRVASELLNSLQDPAVIVLADWLKVRGTLKSWTKLWCVLKPGLLLLYKSPKTKSSHWVGTILLTSCHVIERPSKKDGFCFKLFHPLEQSIWAPRGPDKETIGAVVQPLPTAYLIFRAPSQAAGKCWMDALELSLRCSGLLLRSNSSSGTAPHSAGAEGSISHETQWSEADYEKHFNDQDSLKRLIQKSQYLTVPDTDITKSSGSSDISQVTTPSQTPILQQLYNAMTNWEQVVTTGVPELRKLQKLRKYNESPNNANGKCCDISSLDFSPHKAVEKLKQDMSKELMLRSFSSMKQLSQTGTSSEAEDESVIMDHAIPIITVRAVSAPPDLDGDSQNEAPAGVLSGLDTDSESDANDGPNGDNQIEQMEHYNEEPAETPYVPGVEGEFHTSAGEQVEELGEENKSLIWCLLKQVRPGMDLSKVVLPTFILEPRSFLDKLSDSYYHVDILSGAVTEDDPFTRMKLIVQWYLSGFYKKPKGLKKPYNPILGETFRCFWQHPSGSRTYYIAEQVSHHPPVSAFYVTNRQEGFSISCAILAKSKFYGNSTSAMLDGEATLTLLPRGECYKLTTPYAHCKGILMGTLSMELGGKVNIDCENTGYKTELEFKLKPFLGGADYTNVVAGKIKLVKETLATISGHWDGEMRIKDNKTGEESVLFAVSRDIIESRLVRYVVPLESQLPNESERLWQLVSDAIRRDDQVGATEEKSVLEEGQRSAAKERKARFTEWQPQHFQQDTITCKWMYKYADLRPWDPRNDVKQYEIDYKVLTKTRHLAPMVRTSSIVNVDPSQVARFAENRQSSVNILKTTRIQNPGVDEEHQSDSSQSQDNGSPAKRMSVHKLVKAVEQMNKALEEHTRQLMVINAKLERMQFAPSTSQFESPMSSPRTSTQGIGQTIPQSVLIKTFAYVSAALIVSYFLKWLLN